MPTKNALATIRLNYTQKNGAPYRVRIQVWSHSYDHPDPAKRNSLVTGVALTNLPQPNQVTLSNAKITDRYGIDSTGLFRVKSGVDTGFDGFTEWDSGGSCGHGVPNVLWLSYAGVYDERCLADPACDAMRFQNYRWGPYQIVGFNYMLGPVTFEFDATLSSPPTDVKLTMAHIGGNGGNPATRTSNANVFEEFVIHFP